MRLSPEQEDIIKHRGSNLLVSAAAGSGKTRVLVERIIMLLVADGCSLRNMLVVTFTNAAAAEMKSRISDGLNRAIDEHMAAGWNERARDLINELNQINQAQISTLHSFCMEVLRENFARAGVDPAFRICDSAESEIIRSEALDEALEEASVLNQEAVLDLLEMYATPFSEQGLKGVILKMHSFMMSRPDPFEWLDQSIANLEVSADGLAQSAWACSVIGLARQALRQGIILIAQAGQLCQGWSELSDLRKFLEEEHRSLEEIVGTTTNVSFITALQGYEFAPRPQIKKNYSQDASAAGNEAARARDEGKKLVKEAQELVLNRSLEEQARELNSMLPVLTALYHICQEFHNRYSCRKRELGILDFNDLEHLALEVLQDPECAAYYQNRFQHIFVDEYQDTSPIQEALLACIRRSGNMFMVGDVKQSIYRFRLADPGIFLAKSRDYAQGEPSMGCLKLLDCNYRSQPEIIAGINYLFGRIMTEETAEIDYSTGVLRAGNETGSSNDSGELSELIIVAAGGETAPGFGGGESDDTDNDDDLDAGFAEDGSGLDHRTEAASLLEDLKKDEMEAWALAGRIRQLVGGYECSRASLEEAETPVRYRDIVILMRATSMKADVFSSVLGQAGIPVYTDSGGGYFDTLEVRMVIDLLRVIDNKRQDVPLISVMHSPFMDFSLAELAEVRIFSRSAGLEDPSYVAAVLYYAGHNNGELADRLHGMLARLQDWKEQSRILALDDFIWSLLMDTGFYYYAGALPGGRQRKANLDLLLEKARAFESTSLRGLFNFIGFVDRIRAGTQDSGAASLIGENDDVVRIMSIHKSKGLEFPVVFVAGLSRRFNLQDRAERMPLHGGLGIGPHYIDLENRVFMETLPRKAILAQNHRESLAEEMRILYVAMTRAESRLILVCSEPDPRRAAVRWAAEFNEFVMMRARSYMDWLGPVFIRHPVAGSRLCPMLEGAEPAGGMIADDSRWAVRLVTARDLENEIASARSAPVGHEKSSPAAPDGAEISLSGILGALAWQYPYAAAVRVPSKLSVTSAGRFNRLEDSSYGAVDDASRPLPFNVPGFAVQAGEMGPAQIGTIYHLAMQNMDLTHAGSREDIESNLRAMVERELLLPEEAAVLDVVVIQRFYDSELGQRMLASPVIRRETPFNLKIAASRLLDGMGADPEELLLQGVIDLFFEEDGQLVLVDYKNSHSGAGRDQLLDSYGLQINLYREALERITGQNVKSAYLYILNSGETIEVLPRTI